MTATQYGAKITAIIDERTGGFEYPESFESDVNACFVRWMSPQSAADELLAAYADSQASTPDPS